MKVWILLVDSLFEAVFDDRKKIFPYMVEFYEISSDELEELYTTNSFYAEDTDCLYEIREEEVK